MKTQQLRPVNSLSQVLANVAVFDKAAKAQHQGVTRLLSHVRAWYAVPASDGTYRFGPSKFIGYEQMTADQYAKEAPRMDVRKTEARLEAWATELTEGDPEYHAVFSALEAFCFQHGAAPNRLARISVLSADAAKPGVSESALVKALSVLISSLSDEGKRDLKRIAFS